MVLELSDAALGVLLASVAAVGFAGQFLFVRLGTELGEVTDGVLVVLCCNVALLAPPALALYSPPYVDLFTPVSVAAFGMAGLAGMFVARLLTFKSVQEIGANRSSPVIASNVFFATVFAVAVLGEQLTAIRLAGIVLIVAGIAVVSWETAAESGAEESLRETGALLVVPVAAAASIGIEPIFISIGLAAGTLTLPGIVVMAATATVAFVAYLRWTGTLRPVPLRSASTGWFVAGGVSTTVAFVAYFAALEIAPVVVVMPLLQLTPLIVVVCSALFLPRRLERVTWRVVAAALVVVVGATLVSVSG